MDSSWLYNSVYKKSPQILKAKPYSGNSTYTTTYGGPWYIEVGREVAINIEYNLEANATSSQFNTFFYHDYL